MQSLWHAITAVAYSNRRLLLYCTFTHSHSQLSGLGICSFMRKAAHPFSAEFDWFLRSGQSDKAWVTVCGLQAICQLSNIRATGL